MSTTRTTQKELLALLSRIATSAETADAGELYGILSPKLYTDIIATLKEAEMDDNNTNETPVRTYHFRVGYDFTITSPRPLDSIDWSAIRANAINALQKMDENEFYYSILKVKED